MGFFSFFVAVMKVTFIFALFVASVFTQQIGNLPTVILIDDFSVGANVQRLTVSLESDLVAGQAPVVATNFFTEAGCTGLLGCSRDMEIEVNSGFVGRDFTSDIFRINDGLFVGEWTISNPKTSRSVCSVQYDGPDESFNLDLNGLGGLDFTAGDSLFLSALTDLPVDYTVRIYDRDGGVCETDIEVPVLPGDYYYSETFLEIDFDDFDSLNCDLTDVGAVEFFLPSNDAVDAIVKRLAVVGEIPPEPSASATPPPPPPGGFTWYTFDDDDNGRSPCSDERPRKTYFVSDDNIIYYYFFGVNDAQNFESESASSVLTIAVSFIMSVVAFML